MIPFSQQGERGGGVLAQLCCRGQSLCLTTRRVTFRATEPSSNRLRPHPSSQVASSSGRTHNHTCLRGEPPEAVITVLLRAGGWERYCIDILTQIAAVSTALESVSVKLLEDHVRHCVADALAAGDAEVAAEKSEDLLAAVQRFSRTR